MISLSKIKSSTIESGKRILKVIGIGGSAYTAKESYPFGFDSVPPEGYTALYSDTSNRDESVIIGYINKSQLAEVGGARMYAVGSFGEVSGFVYVRASGDIELNGSNYSAVRFQELKTQIDLLQTQINSQWPLISSGIATGGGVYNPTNVSIDLTSSESATVKLK